MGQQTAQQRHDSVTGLSGKADQFCIIVLTEGIENVGQRITGKFRHKALGIGRQLPAAAVEQLHVPLKAFLKQWRKFKRALLPGRGECLVRGKDALHLRHIGRLQVSDVVVHVRTPLLRRGGFVEDAGQLQGGFLDGGPLAEKLLEMQAENRQPLGVVDTFQA